MSKRKSEQIGLRVEESLKKTLEKIAYRETRTVSQQVEHFVKQGLKDYFKKNPNFKTDQDIKKNK